MIAAYFPRLLCLCFASFFLVHTALAILVRLGTPAALRRAERIRPQSAVRFLLALRMAPVALAVSAVLGLCVPSYLWLEPDSTTEKMGFACFAMALLGAAIWGISITRVLRAISGSVRYIRECRRAGCETRLPGESSPVLVIGEEAPLLALAGVIRPRLIISRGVVRALSAEQLEAALRHEDVHRASLDNFKRLLILLAPEVFPLVRCFAALERSWARLTEWATDDEATAGDPRRAISLAAALVRVARMGAGPRLSILLTSLLADDRDLSTRVDRLLQAQPRGDKPIGRLRVLAGSAVLLVAGSFASALLVPSTLPSVHHLLEQLLH